MAMRELGANSATSFLDRFGGLLDEAATAQLEEKAKAERETAVRRKLEEETAARQLLEGESYAARRARYLAKHGPTAQREEYEASRKVAEEEFERFGTPDTMTQMRLKKAGGIYEDPTILKLRMREDPEALRAELEAQAAGPAPMEAAPGPKRAGVYAPTPTERGKGTYSHISAGGESKVRERAQLLLKQLAVTPASKTVAMRDYLKYKPEYADLGLKQGTLKASMQVEADALSGKLPMHAVGPMLKFLSSAAEAFGEDEDPTSGSLPPTIADAQRLQAGRQQAREAKIAAEKEERAQAQEQVADEEQPGGALRSWWDRAGEALGSARATIRGIPSPLGKRPWE